MKKSFLLFFLLLMIQIKISPLFSQQITFNKVKSPIGSFSGFVGGITQDNNGYMWFATGGGLFRYDGYKFKMYSNDQSNNASLSANHLETIYADRKGMIWIPTWINGLDRLDPVTSIFTHFRHDPNDPESLSNDTVRAVLEDHEGVIWIGTQGGLDRYNLKTGKFQNYHNIPNDPYSLSCNRVRKIYEDRQGTLWVGTGSIWSNEGGETDEGGLNRFDQRTGKFVRYLHDPDNPHSLINNKVQAICEDSRGVFWIGTAGDGLHTMNRSTGTFERHLYDQAHPERLSRPPLTNTGFTDQITFIKEDAIGSIWIGTLANGLNRYDPQTQRTVHYGYKDSAVGFIDNSAWSSFNSRDGIFWIGTFEGGLYRIDPYHKDIPYTVTGSNVYAFDDDPANGLWVGTTAGLLLQKRNTGTIRKFVNEPNNPASLSSTVILTIYRDEKGILWVGTVNGLNRFNAISHTNARYLHNPKDTNSISAGRIFALEDAGNDSLWVGLEYGLDLINKRAGTFIHFKNNPKDTNSFSGINGIIALLIDNRANLWIGEYAGGGFTF